MIDFQPRFSFTFYFVTKLEDCQFSQHDLVSFIIIRLTYFCKNISIFLFDP